MRLFIYDINNLYIFEVVLKYYNILENNFKIIEQKNSIFYLIKNKVIKFY